MNVLRGQVRVQGLVPTGSLRVSLLKSKISFAKEELDQGVEKGDSGQQPYITKYS